LRVSRAVPPADCATRASRDGSAVRWLRHRRRLDLADD